MVFLLFTIMKTFKYIFTTIILSSLIISMVQAQDTRVLIFTKTKGFRHQSIEKGREVLTELLLAKNIQVDSTENSDLFTTRNLQKYNALIFLNTTGDLFNEKQQQALVKYRHPCLHRCGI
jgi:hypothetical protein